VIGGFFPTDPPGFYEVPFGYSLIDPIKESLAEAGFADLRITVLKIEKEIPDVAPFARGLIYGNPVFDQIRARGSVERDRVVEAIAERFRREFGPGPSRIPLQTIMFEAKKP
jgi:hypothetical protein